MKFDPTINIPTVIALIGFAATIATAWSQNNERHAKTETSVATQGQQLDALERRQIETQKEFKQDVLKALEEIKIDLREIRRNGSHQERTSR